MSAITVAPEDLNMALVALTPAEMPAAQHALCQWCDMKVAALRQEKRDLEGALQEGVAAGMKTGAWTATIARTERRITYYEKLKAAVAAGYLIVPNFPINIFAVRVKRAKQPEKTYDSRWAGFRAKPELLPVGEGRYVDEALTYRDDSRVERLPDGKEKHVREYTTQDYDAVDFPVTLVKPSIVERTRIAMAARIFDQMGIVQNTSGRDPIVVGQILDPRGNGRCCTFFVAWWLDTSTL